VPVLVQIVFWYNALPVLTNNAINLPALIAGTIPIAIGLNEASKQRTSMGVAIVGGLISSTLLDTFLTPALFWLFGRRPAARIVADRSTDTY
jgi:Cu/Ag efflux pump CusA